MSKSIDWGKVQFMQTIESFLDEEEIRVFRNALIAYKVKLEADINSLTQYIVNRPAQADIAQKLIKGAQKELDTLCRLYEKFQALR